MYAYPVFRRHPATSTRLLLAPSAEAKRLENVGEVLTEARTFVSTHGGDPSDQFLVMAHCKLQFGKYHGQRFRWLLENSLGYAVYLMLSIYGEVAQMSPLTENKQLFLEYTSQIREMEEECEKHLRRQEMQAEAHATGDHGCLMVESGDFQGWSMKEVYEDKSKEAQALIEYLVKADVRPNTNMAIFKTYVMKRQASSSTTTPSSIQIQTGVQQTAAVKPLLGLCNNIVTSQLVKTRTSPVKHYPFLPPPRGGEPPAEHLAQRQLFTSDTSTLSAEDADDDEELALAAAQCEAQLSAEACTGPSTSVAAAKPALELPVHWQEQLTQFQHGGSAFQRQQKTQEASVLIQGLTPSAAVADSQLPSPREKMDEAPCTSGSKFQFFLPTKKEEQAPILQPDQLSFPAPASPPASASSSAPAAPAAPAVTRKCLIAPTTTGIVLPVPAPGSLVGTITLNPGMTVPTVIAFSGAATLNAGFISPAATAVPVSRYTQRNRRRRAMEDERNVHKRKYTRAVHFNTCSKCGQPKTKEYGHSRYRNATFCSQASNGQSLDDWLAEQRQRDKGRSPPPPQ